jgi:Family of unknown function (DUF6186)
MTHTSALVVWAVLFAALIGWQVVALCWPARWVGLGRVVGLVMQHVAVRVVLLLAWAWLGWHLFAR